MKKITMYTTIKIIFLILFSLFQICMVTSIFKDVKVVDKISLNSNTERTKLKSDKKNQDDNIFL